VSVAIAGLRVDVIHRPPLRQHLPPFPCRPCHPCPTSSPAAIPASLSGRCRTRGV
jgi:hypothetical protein